MPNYDNVASVSGGEGIVKTAVDAFGRVDILINNAGILRDKTFNKMEEENWDAVMNVHLKGAYCVSRPAFNVMREKGYGRIVMTTSGAGLFGNFGQSNYAAAKMGLIGLAHVLNLEGAKYNIKTNVIAPVAATRFSEDVLPPPVHRKAQARLHSPRGTLPVLRGMPGRRHDHQRHNGVLQPHGHPHRARRHPVRREARPCPGRDQGQLAQDHEPGEPEVFPSAPGDLRGVADAALVEKGSAPFRRDLRHGHEPEPVLLRFEQDRQVRLHGPDRDDVPPGPFQEGVAVFPDGDLEI